MTTALPPKPFTTANGHRLAHVEMGRGDAIMLLHGNPTARFLWRDVMPPPAGLGSGRCTLEGTHELLAAPLAALDAEQRVTPARHDRGSALGFHWARLHPQQVRGIA